MAVCWLVYQKYCSKLIRELTVNIAMEMTITAKDSEDRNVASHGDDGFWRRVGL